MWQVQVSSISWKHLARNRKRINTFSAATIWLYVMKIFKSSFDIVNISRNLRQTFLLAFGGTKKIQGGWGEFPRSHIESFIEEHNGFNSSYGIFPGIWCNSRVKIVPFQNILTWQFCLIVQFLHMAFQWMIINAVSKFLQAARCWSVIIVVSKVLRSKILVHIQKLCYSQNVNIYMVFPIKKIPKIGTQ